MKLAATLLIQFAVIIAAQSVLVPPPPPMLEEVNDNLVNPELLGGGIEGDIYLPGLNMNSLGRGVAYNVVNKWPSGIVPYDISAIPSMDNRKMIENAMQTIMYETGSPINGSNYRTACVQFRARQSTDKTFLTIVHGTGCNAHLGYWANYPLKMTLQQDSNANCFHTGTIQHELLHALGFDHEHSRPDRDNFVQIKYENIDSQWHYAFEKRVIGTTAVDLKTPYDYNSIMHYGTNYFSKNGQQTVVPKQANVRIGNREKLSPIDITEVRRFYGCQP